MVELVFIPLASFLDFLGRLAIWPIRHPLLWMCRSKYKDFDPLAWIHNLLDELVLERPGFWGGLWRLFHRPDWQRSAKFNARTWVTSFSIFWPLAHQLGYAWYINLGVTLLVDTVAYMFHKEWVWAQRHIDFSRSALLTYSFTFTTFFANLGLSWVMLNDTSIGIAPSKVALGAFGIVINPLVFLYRDKVALRDRQQKTEMV